MAVVDHNNRGENNGAVAPVSEMSPVARLPDPPVTSNIGDWTSGPPAGGNLPGQPRLPVR